MVLTSPLLQLSLEQEMSLYRKEERKAFQDLERLKCDDADASDIEEAVGILGENDEGFSDNSDEHQESNLFNTGQMLPSAQSRLATALNELRALIVRPPLRDIHIVAV